MRLLLITSLISGCTQAFVGPTAQFGGAQQQRVWLTARRQSERAETLSRIGCLPTHVRVTLQRPTLLTLTAAKNADDNNDGDKVDESMEAKKSEGLSKEDLVKAVGEKMRRQKQAAKASSSSSKDLAKDGGDGDDANLFDRLNPFKAGQNLRKTIDTALESISIPADKKSLYYLDDRLNGEVTFERNPALERLEQDDFVPEVLVVGATGEVGRLVVRRLLLDGRFRVRVLVRNLYTKTLNLLGTGVTYCQGDLSNPDSLEYALTDVDKIIFCASAPRPDEDMFQQKFEDFMKETLETQDAERQTEKLVMASSSNEKIQTTTTAENIEWEQLASVLEVRARLAEQVDCIGMQNLVRAYQDVRVADYGTSQAAKRSLFKFQDRPEDFNLFSIDDYDELEEEGVGNDGMVTASKPVVAAGKSGASDDYEYDYDDEDEYAKYDEDYGVSIENRRDESVKTQVQWMRNQFEHGVFVGKVPKMTSSGVGGEAAIVSSRLRSREDPDNGIDLSASFAGFIARVCSDGGVYEAFVRTGAYYDDGIEYVCEFSTVTKPLTKNKSPNKFTTVRLPFESFQPVKRKGGPTSVDSIRPFKGQDVRHIGFRYRSSAPGNAMKAKLEAGSWNSFYLALCYIKLYRSQPEPEFVYVSDARIPPVVRNGMVRHDARMLVTTRGDGAEDEADGSSSVLFDESTLKTAVAKDKMARSSEETYYKYRGEEIIKNSGLSYSIVRVPGYNEIPSGEASTIDLRSEPTEGELVAVSRDEVAQVIVSALLDPNALNKSFYVGKKKGKSRSVDEDFSAKFAALPTDAII